MPVLTPREELIRIHKRLVARIKREIRRSIGPENPRIARYYERYQRSFRSFEPSNKQALIEAVIAGELVYNGDYHTLRQSQKIPIRILTEVVQVRKDVIICIEMVIARHQAVLDRYMAGRIDEKTFLEAIDYEKSWGFNWSHYKVLFDFAREHGLRLVAINNVPPQSAASLLERDREAAEIVARESIANPGSLVYVIDGDLHIAREHLPAEIDKLLAAAGVHRKTLFIFQNSEHLYWRMARKGMEQLDVVRLADDAFCVMNTTPQAKYQSYFNWLEHREELPHHDPADWTAEEKSFTYTEQVASLVQTIASFLGIERNNLRDFSVYTAGDLDFLSILRKSGEYTAHEIEEIRAQIQREESYFITRGNIIYLANLSINHAAEEATHFIHHQCAGEPAEALTLKADFYSRILHEAIGFMGSKIINHKRTCYKEKDFDDFVRQTRRRRLTPKLAEVRRISRLVLQHKKMERDHFRDKRPNRLQAVYQLPTGLHLGVSHALGYMLGDKMYYALVGGEIGKNEVRSLFYERFDTGKSGFDKYMDLARRMDQIHERCYAKDVCL